MCDANSKMAAAAFKPFLEEIIVSIYICARNEHVYCVYVRSIFHKYFYIVFFVFLFFNNIDKYNTDNGKWSARICDAAGVQIAGLVINFLYYYLMLFCFITQSSFC